jgi:hypothetical protein
MAEGRVSGAGLRAPFSHFGVPQTGSICYVEAGSYVSNISLARSLPTSVTGITYCIGTTNVIEPSFSVMWGK